MFLTFIYVNKWIYNLIIKLISEIKFKSFKNNKFFECNNLLEFYISVNIFKTEFKLHQFGSMI